MARNWLCNSLSREGLCKKQVVRPTGEMPAFVRFFDRETGHYCRFLLHAAFRPGYDTPRPPRDRIHHLEDDFMRRLVGCLIVAVLALPALRGNDDKDSSSPKDQYQKLIKEVGAERSKIIKEYNAAKGGEKQKVLEKYFALPNKYASKFLKLAEDHPKDPVATDALFWILQNSQGGDAYAKAVEKVTAKIGEMPLGNLATRLRMMRGGSNKLVEAVFKRAEKEESDAKAGDLLAWIATNGNAPSFTDRATDRLLEKYPDHPAIARVCAMLGRSQSPKAIATLKNILNKSPKNSVKAAAAMAIGANLAAATDKLGDNLKEADKVAAEAESYYTMVVDQYAKDNAAMKKQAERELHALKTTRVGKEAPIITAPDLDKKEFKLSDYRGKVVLLDFWGNW
jgi:hypothetical protein